MTRRFLFLDIDGVINPFDQRDASQLGDDWNLQRINGYRVWTSHELGGWLNGLIADGVEFVWATTWIKDPEALAEYATAMGMATDLPRIGYIRYEGAGCGKRLAIEEFLALVDDPYVAAWVDDDHGFRDIDWAHANGIATFTPDTRFGISGKRIRRQITEALTVPVTV